MKYIAIASILILVFGLDLYAQDKPTCPSIDVEGGGVVTEIDEPTTFTAIVENYDLSKLSFKWTVSGGEILEGQGTSKIKALRTGYDENLTAIVEVIGLPENCSPAIASETGSPICRPPARLFDEYAALNNGDMKARLGNLFVELGNNPGAQGYIISYGTDKEIALREKRIRDALTFLNLDTNRITLVRGGANPRGKGVWTKVWIVPPGALNPTPDM